MFLNLQPGCIFITYFYIYMQPGAGSTGPGPRGARSARASGDPAAPGTGKTLNLNALPP